MTLLFKKSILLSTICFFTFGFAQEKVSETINSSTNTKLKEVYYEQEMNFKQLETFLISNEVNNNVLLGYYNKLMSTNSNFRTAYVNNLEYALIERYYKERLKQIDALYSTYKEAIKKNVVEKITEDNPTIDLAKRTSSTQTNANSQENLSNTEIIAPNSEDCAKINPAPTNCAQYIISKYFANRIQIPDLREFEESKYALYVSFIITKEGTFELKNISSSKKYFDIEMEVLKVSLALSKNKKFIPGQQNGKAVNFAYVLPLNLYLVNE